MKRKLKMMAVCIASITMLYACNSNSNNNINNIEGTGKQYSASEISDMLLDISSIESKTGEVTQKTNVDLDNKIFTLQFIRDSGHTGMLIIDEKKQKAYSLTKSNKEIYIREIKENKNISDEEKKSILDNVNNITPSSNFILEDGYICSYKSADLEDSLNIESVVEMTGAFYDTLILKDDISNITQYNGVINCMVHKGDIDMGEVTEQYDFMKAHDEEYVITVSNNNITNITIDSERTLQTSVNPKIDMKEVNEIMEKAQESDLMDVLFSMYEFIG